MGFLKRLLGTTASVRPEDYRLIYVRWNKGGNEYGPLTFSDIVTRSWSGLPLQARFEGESKWSSYDRVLGIIEGLEASDDQVTKLVKKGVLAPDAPRPNFKEAITQLDRIATEERAAKAKQPATPYMRKKMDGLGINYPDGVTRAEAKALVDEHEERAEIQEAANALRERGVVISKDMLNIATEQSGAPQGVGDELDELLDVFEELGDLGCAPEVPNIESIDILRKLSAQYREALDEAENVECELEAKELIIGYDEFRLVGSLPKKGMLAIKRSVVLRCIAGSWNFERHVLEVVAEHMPNVRVKQCED